MAPRWAAAVVFGAVFGGACCAGREVLPPDAGTHEEPAGDGGGDAGSDGGEVPFVADAGMEPSDAGIDLSVGTWNLLWFGDTRPTYGPSDDARQYQNVRGVLADAGVDVWGLQEVVDADKLRALAAELPGYTAVVANEPSVEAGEFYYYPDEPKVALLFRNDVVTVKAATVLLVESQYHFAYRPPLKLDVTVSKGGFTRDLVLIVLHMKAGATTEDWTRRRDAAAALKTWLDAVHADTEVLVLGDWNDDLDTSIITSPPTPSPFTNFTGDAADYYYLSSRITETHQRTTVRYTEAIDHLLATNELAARWVRGSTEVVRPDLWASPVPSYGSSTSDHYPVISKLRLGLAP